MYGCPSCNLHIKPDLNAPTIRTSSFRKHLRANANTLQGGRHSIIHSFDYGRPWCVNIASAANGGVGSPPADFQCTWRRRLEGPIQYCLVASLAGQEARAARTGTWGDELKSQRFKLINAQALLEPNGWTYETSVEINKNGKVANKFGNRAKTYPFLETLEYVKLLSLPQLWLTNTRTAWKPGDTLYGLALHSDYLQDHSTIHVNERLMHPCRNCNYLIDRYLTGAKRENFRYARRTQPPFPGLGQPLPQTRGQ